MKICKLGKISPRAFASLALFGATAALPAASVFLTTNDTVNTSSFNSAGKWSDGQPPSATNDYCTGDYFIRTPTDAGGVAYTFAGHSLTLSRPAANWVRSLIVKSGPNDVFTINNLTNAAGGVLDNGGGGNVLETFTGNLWTIAGNSTVMVIQGPLIIGYPLAGADGVILTNIGETPNGITYNGNNSTFTGKFYISYRPGGGGGGPAKVILNAPNSQPGNPSTFTPDQIRLEVGCTLQDNVGLTFNNANGGITLAGDAIINTAAATIIAEPITGAYSLTKAGAGTLYLDARNTYTGTTVVTNGTLTGVGTIGGPVVVAPAGNLAGGNAAGHGTLTISSSLKLQGNAILRISKNSSLVANDSISGVTTALYGGTLVISNITVDGTPLVPGDTFPLFGASSGSGNFTSTVGSPGAGLAYSFNSSNGVLAVVASPGVPRLTGVSISGGNVTITGTNGTASTQYRVLTSTNVALPLASWTSVHTDTFPGSSFSATFPLTNGSRPWQFYRLSIP